MDKDKQLIFVVPFPSWERLYLFLGGSEMEMIQETIMYFHKGGLVMWPLLFCSFAVFAIAIERFLFYKSADSGEKFKNDYCSLLSENNLQTAKELAQNTPGQIAEILFKAADNAKTQEDLVDYLENEMDILTALLKNKLDYLSIIVTMSPLLGLLGTIVGMIGAFSIFNVHAGAPMAITGGIGEALIATASGLCVAIVSLCFHSYFTHRMDNIITNTGRCATALIQANRRSMQK